MTIETAALLQKIRKEKGLSQEELADKLGVSRQAVSKWECGEASPDTDKLILLSRLYGISIDELLNNQPAEQKNSGDQQNIENDYHDEAAENPPTAQTAENCEEENSGSQSALLQKRRHKKIMTWTECAVTVAVTIAYILIGVLTKQWHPTWIIFLAIPTVPSFVNAILQRDASEFNYPIFITAVYLLLGFLFGIWHPAWVVFLTIPVYYAIF